MLIEREGPQTSRHRQWRVNYGERQYRVSCSWSGGTQRMEWEVEVYCTPPQQTSYYRRIAGRWLINAVREHEAQLLKAPT